MPQEVFCGQAIANMAGAVMLALEKYSRIFTWLIVISTFVLGYFIASIEFDRPIVSRQKQIMLLTQDYTEGLGDEPEVVGEKPEVLGEEPEGLREEDLGLAVEMDSGMPEELVVDTDSGKMSDKILHRELGVRLAADLKFDLTHCPSSSLMLNKKKNFVPRHQDCPTLFIVGARKGGTTSLIQYISKHPDFKSINLDKGPKAGEAFYFGSQYFKKSWTEYISLFPRGVMTGESSVENLVNTEAPKRLYVACGLQAKVVMLLRDPVERMRSNLLMRVRLHGRMDFGTKFDRNTHFTPVVEQYVKAFKHAMEKKEIEDAKNLHEDWRKFVGLFSPTKNMLFEGVYFVHLMNWLCNFPAENILILRSEEFFSNPSEILATLVRYLGLKELDSKKYDEITARSYNSAQQTVPDYQKLTNSDIESLMGIFTPFNKALFTLLDWNATKWHS